MNLRSSLTPFLLAFVTACEGSLPPSAQTQSEVANPSLQSSDSGPKISPAGIVIPEFSLKGGQSVLAGTAFFVSIPGQTNPIGLTAHHVFGEAGGLDHQLSAMDLGDAVRAVHVHDFDGSNRQAIPAGSMIVLPSAGHSGDTGLWSTDVAAFRAPKAFSSRTLSLAEKGAAEGETVWLVARVIKGNSVGKRFHRARIVKADAHELAYRFDDQTLEIRATSGAPVVNAAGEVIGLNLGSHLDGKTLLGIGNPVESIRTHLARGLSWETSLHVGAVFSLSGSEEQFGKEAVLGIELALKEVNQAGGIRGRNIDTFCVDNGSNPQRAVNAVLQLIKQPKMDIVAILGDVASSRTKAGGIVANKLGVPMLTPAATNPSVTQVGPFVFRGCFEDAVQGKTAARYLIHERKRKRIGILYSADDLYSSELTTAFREEAKRLGATTFETSFLHNEKDFTGKLSELQKQRPDIIYAPIYYNVMTEVARAGQALGFSGRDFFGGDGWADESLAKSAGAALEGAEFTNHWVVDLPSPENRAFVTAYKARFDVDPSTISALSFDAATLLADALKRAPTPTREAVRDALANTRDFVGVTGRLTMGPDRNPEKDVVIVRLENGRFRFAASSR